MDLPGLDFAEINKALTKLEAYRAKVENAWRRIRFDKNISLTLDQARILWALGDRRLHTADLVRENGYIGTNISYNLAKLERDGYLRKNGSSVDARLVIIEPMAKAERVVELLKGLKLEDWIGGSNAG